MRTSPYLPFLLPPLILLLLLGAWHRADLLPSPEPAWPAELADAWNAAARPEAEQLLRQAIARLDDPTRLWLRTALWLHAHLPEADYQAEGVYQRGTGHLRRLELRTRLSSGRAEHVSGGLLLVCDGVHFWQASRTGPHGYEEVRRWKLPPTTSSEKGLSTHLPLPGSDISHSALCGPQGMLCSLLGQLIWVHCEDQADHCVIVGTWSPALRASLVTGKGPWPEALPRFCRLQLRRSDLWPGRIEWWGPREPGGKDVLLVEIEFRDPQWGMQLDELRCHRLFHFEPGGARIIDVAAP